MNQDELKLNGPAFKLNGAAAVGAIDILEYLVDKYQYTLIEYTAALNLAAEHNQLKATKFFIEKDINCFDKSAIELAQFYEHTDVIQYLEEETK